MMPTIPNTKNHPAKDVRYIAWVTAIPAKLLNNAKFPFTREIESGKGHSERMKTLAKKNRLVYIKGSLIPDGFCRDFHYGSIETTVSRAKAQLRLLDKEWAKTHPAQE